MTRSRLVRSTLFAACLLAPRSSTAQPQSDADKLIDQGIHLRQQGHDDQALTEFQRAYAITPTPRARAQIGLAEQALGQWVSAEQHVREALAARDDAWIGAHRSVLEGALTTITRHLGSLEIRGGIAGAEVLLDGARVGALPLRDAQRVEAGTRTLEVRAPGYYPISRTIIVAPGETARETVELVAEAKAPTAAGATGTTTPAPPPPNAATTEPVPSLGAADTNPSVGSTQRTLGWIGLGAAGAFVATGIVALVARGQQVSAYNNDPTCPGMGSPSQPAACADRESAASTWGAVSIVGFIGAGVLAATSVTLLLTAPRPSARHAVACGVTGPLLTCGSEF